MELIVNLITASVTVFLAVLTGIYVAVIYRLLNKMEQTVNETHRPEVAIYLMFDKQQYGINTTIHVLPI